MDVPFIGRKRELDSCIRILSLKEEQSRIIMIEGAPGSGKTSILHKVMNAAGDEGYLVCFATHSEEHETLSLQIWMNILEKCRLGMLKSAPAFAGGGNELEQNLFTALYGAWDGIKQFREIGAENKKHLLFSWIGSYLACCSKQRKLCIAIDNLHLCGRSSISLLLYLYSILENYPVSFILTSGLSGGSAAPELSELADELQFKPANLNIRLGNLSMTDIEVEYAALKGCNSGLPPASEVYRLTLGNPLGISTLLRTGAVHGMEDKPLDRLWNRYKKSLDVKAVGFIEYMSLMGNYISRTEAAMMAGLLDEKDINRLTDVCLSSLVLKPQEDGFSFFHEEFRKTILIQMGQQEKTEKLRQIITLFENSGNSEGEKAVIRLAGLYVQLAPSGLCGHQIKGLSAAADIMMRWNAWDKASGYLEKMRQAALEMENKEMLSSIDTRLAFCYLENMDNQAFAGLFPPLAARLIEADDRKNLRELLNLNSFIWNFYPEIFLSAIEHLLKVDTEERNILLVARAVIRSENPFTIKESLTEIRSLEEEILQSASQEDRYRYYTGLGYLQSLTREFDSASDALLKADDLQIGRFRFTHLVALAKIALFTDCNENKDLVLRKIEHALKVTRNGLIIISYQGMLQRRFLYDGRLEAVLSVGTDPSRESFDYLSIPRFMAYLWLGDKVKTESLTADFAAVLNERAGENEINGPLVGILWLLSAHSLITGSSKHCRTLKAGITSLLHSGSIHEGFRIQLLISAARISTFEYSPAECRQLYDELRSTTDFFLEEEIHSVEIAKGLLAEGFGDYAAAGACYKTALSWCVSVDEKPWRTWLLTGQLKSAPADRAEALRIASECGFSQILKILGEKPKSAYSLSARETEVLALVTKGFTDRETGNYLNISEHTVANHLRSIYRKLNASNRVEASRIALTEDLIDS